MTDYVVCLILTNDVRIMTRVSLVGIKAWESPEERVFDYFTPNSIHRCYREINCYNGELAEEQTHNQGINLNHIVEIKFIKIE
jgi:hypothetical protein